MTPPIPRNPFAKLPKPYYDDGKGIVIYHGDSQVIAPQLGVKFNLLLTDPPYGIKRSNGMGGGGFDGTGKIPRKPKKYDGDWDDEPPSRYFLEQLISPCDSSIIWGGNFFELPRNKKWLVWNKLNTMPSFSDAELAWTNLPGDSVKMFTLNMNGDVKNKREHPTQKPVDLFRWCLSLVKDCETIFDPYLGSGTTARAAKDLGKKCVGIEREERYCEVAARRLQQEVLL